MICVTLPVSVTSHQSSQYKEPFTLFLKLYLVLFEDDNITSRIDHSFCS